ncbi:CaiB/BaiF CoA transferase family protein [Frigidibacter sp. ROC022]|uniref:CaiB/BaiF CoA transferase family protein n=1 Tax=Frigidibacter sp. ROC022 TaxID=2971796 RepID=UPI00215AF52D|nr:CoA transferase [Frigidibacter sp. ROC022]MCR8725790.1 CoA transferase [Frigidibacter sp. ROC022]
MAPPLSGLRVLAVEQYGAGPFGTQHLADLGAEVIKIENRATGGDYARSLGPFFVEGAEADEGSLFFQSINRNKKSLTLDLGNREAQAVLHRLVATADAVADNLRGDVPERLGLTYAQLKEANPAIVCAHCSAYGRTGERADWPGYDFLMQAEAGYFHMSGEPDTPPTRMGLSIVDFMAGNSMALGLVSAVLAARESGIGRDVDVNLYDTALFNLSYLATWTLNSLYDPARVSRSAHATVVPCQLFRTGDGWIYIMCNKEKFWTALCKAIDRPELAADPAYATFADRAGRREELTRILDSALQARTTADWLQRLQGVVPVAPVRTPREALMDPALRETGRVETLELPGGAAFDVLASPLDAGDKPPSRPCPPMGTNTDEILDSAGFSEAEIRDLHRRGIV